jgi:peptidoglycan/xylan/chitin deacetylase (PgdA/CDA1 family)/SAM-dependent methyltransferase
LAQRSEDVALAEPDGDGAGALRGWDLSGSPGAIDPGAVDRVTLEVTAGKQRVAAVVLPALGVLTRDDIRGMLRTRIPYLPHRRTLPALAAARAIRPWPAALRTVADLRGLALRTQLRRRRLARDVLRGRAKLAAIRAVHAVIPAPAATEAPPGTHGAALRNLLAASGAEHPTATFGGRRGPAGVTRDPHDRTSAQGWDAFFAQGEDPWDYDGSEYERVKYAETLELLPDPQPRQALELGCAEGLFTAMLAPRVGSLIATDISAVALQRAAARCAGLDNVDFRQLNFVTDELPSDMDLIVCSEALYYCGSRPQLRRVIRKIFRSLRPGGVLLTANANQVADDPGHSGFDWGEDFGSRTIRELLATGGLRLVHELETPLYRVHAFQKPLAGAASPSPRLEQRPLKAKLQPDLEGSVLWEGGLSRARLLHTEITASVPILMYHRVADQGPAALSRFRVSPRQFQAQVELLRRSGFNSITEAELLAAREANRPLPGRPVMITFDDGYEDLAQAAWPILRQRGFTATVFVVSEHVGGRAEWDVEHGEAAPLMDWDTLRRLSDQGLQVGAHSASHRPLPDLTTREVYLELLRPKRAIEAELGRTPVSFCYPHGAWDDRVSIAASQCGYELAYSCSEGRSTLTEYPFALSRIEVAGEDDLDAFSRKLGL